MAGKVVICGGGGGGCDGGEDVGRGAVVVGLWRTGLLLPQEARVGVTGGRGEKSENETASVTGCKGARGSPGGVVVFVLILWRFLTWTGRGGHWDGRPKYGQAGGWKMLEGRRDGGETRSATASWFRDGGRGGDWGQQKRRCCKQAAASAGKGRRALGPVGLVPSAHLGEARHRGPRRAGRRLWLE